MNKTIRRIALVANHSWKLVTSTTPYYTYAHGLRELGIEAETFCYEGCETGYDHPVSVISGERKLFDPEFWKKIACDAAVVWSWHANTELMRFIRGQGIKVLAFGDSDGKLSPLYNPVSTFRSGFPHVGPNVMKFQQAARAGVFKMLIDSRAVHRRLASNVLTPNVFTLANTQCIKEFDRVMVRSGHARAAGKVAWLPYPVPIELATGEVRVERDVDLIAVGRWDAWQKNATLLAATLGRVLSVTHTAKVIVIGRDSQSRFGQLQAQFPGRVELHDRLTRLDVGRQMGRSRILLMSSRFEGSPAVGNEMLASGGTIVGTPIPSLIGLTEDGKFGRVSRFHSARSLAKAVHEELSAWERGERDPVRIAGHWRSLVSPRAVVKRMIELLEAAPN